MSRPRLLDLFCGEGGAGMGYHRAGFEVVGVDNAPARLTRYPFEHHEADALTFLHEHGHEFDVIHASPPCTGYSRGTAALPDRLIAATRDLLIATGKSYVIENVEDAKRELRSPVMLCGRMFGLGAIDTDGTPLVLDRHRMFESNVALLVPPHVKHDRSVQVAGVYGGARRDKWEAKHVRKGGYVPPDLGVLRELVGAPWMSEKGCFLSIPPVFTEFLGEQMLAHVRGEVAA
jgi:DNA (cytosine-5)-methyltransferase 1